MSSVVLTLCIVLVLIGLVGSIIPGLPGSPLYLVALLLARYFADASVTTSELWVYIALVAFTFVADFFVPILTTKWFGGTKAGMWGSIIGLIGGFFIPIPTFGLGVIIYPFVGAVLGEMMVHDKEFGAALKSGVGNLIGFILTTLIKIGLGVWTLFRVGGEWWSGISDFISNFGGLH